MLLLNSRSFQPRIQICCEGFVKNFLRKSHWLQNCKRLSFSFLLFFYSSSQSSLTSSIGVKVMSSRLHFLRNDDQKQKTQRPNFSLPIVIIKPMHHSLSYVFNCHRLTKYFAGICSSSGAAFGFDPHDSRSPLSKHLKLFLQQRTAKPCRVSSSEYPEKNVPFLFFC